MMSGTANRHLLCQAKRRLGVANWRRAAAGMRYRLRCASERNIAFPIDQRGRWSLALAFDMTYSDNSARAWTATHQLTLNGKRDDFNGLDHGSG